MLKFTTMPIPIRGYSFKELYNLYNESPKVFRKWLKLHEAAIGPVHGKKYTPKQVKIIFKKIGYPDNTDNLKED